MKYDKINENLQMKYNHLVKLGYEVVGVFLYGSQNYGIDTENSDIDARAIVLPSIRDILNNKISINKTIVMENGEHIEIKDITSMHECFLKQGLSFIEILFTPFKILNPIYSHLYNAILSSAEKIAHYNEVRAIKNMAFMIKNRIERMNHLRPGNKEFFDNCGYDYKELINIVREYSMMKRYINGYDYASCLFAVDRPFIMSVKENPKQFTPEFANMLACDFSNKAMELYESFIVNNKEHVVSAVEKLLNDTKEKIMILYLKKELKKY